MRELLWNWEYEQVDAWWQEECDYRCEVCEEDHCFCEDGRNRRLAHKNDCKSCQRMDEVYFGSYVQHY